jgi:hypothetical protein
MSRVADLFEQLTLPEISRILRRTSVTGLVIAVVAFVGLALLGHWLIGAGACIGFVLGILNIRLVTTSVARIGSSGGDKARHRIASNTMLRLGVTTAIVFALAFTVRDLGMGALGGIAVFYFVFIGNVMRTLLQGAPA